MTTPAPHTYVRSGTGVTAVWIALQGYAPGAQIQPTASPNGNGFWYQCTTGGTTAATPPVWPLTIGGTVTDGTVVWTCEGKAWASGSKTSGSPMTAAELTQLDGSLQALVNGVDGSTHAPTNPMIINGQGLTVASHSPTVIARGGSLSTVSGAIQFGNGDYWNYKAGHSARTRTVVVPCALGQPTPGFGWKARWTDGAMQALAGMIDLSDGHGPQPVSLAVPIRGHNGATLSSVKVNFRIGFPHTTVPTVMPTMRVVRVDGSGNVVPLTSLAAGGDVNGYVAVAKPGSVGLWTGQQALTIACDQNNAIDLSQYTYYVEIVDEQSPGAGYPWTLVAKQPVQLYGVWNGTLGVTIDGVAPANGYRVYFDQGAQFDTGLLSGIYVYSSTNGYTRAPDMQQSSDVTRGMLIPVQQGNSMGSALLQVNSKITNPWVANTSGLIEPWGSGGGGGPGYSYAAGQLIMPSGTRAQNGFYFITDTGGTTAITEPSWPTTVGQTVADGTITWTCVGPVGTALTVTMAGPLDDEVPGTEGQQLFAHGNIYQSATVTYTGITSGAFQ